MEEVIHGPEEFKNDEEVIEELKSFWDDKIKAMKNRFKKKPEYVNAIQFNGNSNKVDVEKFVGKDLKAVLESETAYLAGAGAPIFTLWLSRTEPIYMGDWVVKDSEGELFVEGKDDFKDNYEEIKI